LIALDALLLQAFLGLAPPAQACTPSAGILCAEHASDDPAGKASSVHVHSCCTLVLAGTLALPGFESVALASPFAAAARLIWRPRAELPRTGPHSRPGTARGPPAA
jgi:hypothetical protein